MAKSYACPKCGHEVPLANINVAKDVMLCTACGETSSFSEVVETIEDAQREDEVLRLLSGPPPKHLKVEADPTDVTGKVQITYRKISPAALFLVPFTLFWAGFSMSGIYGSQILKGEFDLHLSLFGIPFLIGSIALVSTCLYMLFGKQVLTLVRGKGTFFRGVGAIGRRKRFEFDRTTRVEQGFSSVQFNGRNIPELHLRTSGNATTVHIGVGMSEDALGYVEALLKREISRL